MHTLARAFVRAKERFAFSTATEIQKWKQLGIRPVVFPKRRAPRQFGAIDDALKAWIDRTRMGLREGEEDSFRRMHASVRTSLNRCRRTGLNERADQGTQALTMTGQITPDHTKRDGFQE